MVPNLKHIKLSLYLIILYSIFPQSISILSFTYPQSITLSTGYIIVVEKNGIFKCDPSFTTIINSVYTFDDEDKISSVKKLSKTLIKRSSLMILVFSNYKIYIINISTGALLYNSPDKLIPDDDPEYLALHYYTSDQKLYFIIGYIDKFNNLNLQYYKVTNSYNTIHFIDSLSLDSVTMDIDSVSKTLTFQNKGLSCDHLKDTSSDKISYFTCFIIATDNSNDYLIPLTFDDTYEVFTFKNDKYTMDYINVNNCNQIKSDSDFPMYKSYVCYVTKENIGTCVEFSLSTTKVSTGWLSSITYYKNLKKIVGLIYME